MLHNIDVCTITYDCGSKASNFNGYCSFIGITSSLVISSIWTSQQELKQQLGHPRVTKITLNSLLECISISILNLLPQILFKF